MTDNTHDPKASSWVPGADDHSEFPVQNLPLGVFTHGDGPPTIATAIGDHVVDLKAVADMLDLDAQTRASLAQSTLNALFALPSQARRDLRHALFALLTDPAQKDRIAPALYEASACQMLLPLTVRDFTDFYAGIHHASAVGALLRPENPLLPNYKYIPVGYHGRASSVRVSGQVIRRPNGQIMPADAEIPAVRPSARLDYEVELGFWIGGWSELGSPIPVAEAHEHLAGICLLNDWSARDIQTWEYVPLGPFLAKNFATTVSPWIVTSEALEPFRMAQPPRPEGDPSPLPYLMDDADQASGALSIAIDVAIRTRRMREAGEEPFVLGRTAAANLYWTPAQMIAHHTVNGCDLSAGDLLGTGTISGPGDDARGSLMELSRGGKAPVHLPNGETRTFLEGGDEVILTAHARREGWKSIGLGQCIGTITD